jgi:hypothetical protein
MELEFDFLLPECGNKDNNIGNHHPIELPNPEPVRSYYSCNHVEDKLVDRNFTCKMPIVFEPRPELTGLCINKKHENKQIQHQKTEDLLGDHHISCNPPLCPGKMDAKRYFINIDVESKLKNIDYYTTKCKSHIYKLDPNCDDCRLSCYKDITSNPVNLPERNINKCLEFQEFPNYSPIRENPNIFIRKQQDTVYDYMTHDICNQGPQKVWNNNTKRNMHDYKCKVKSENIDEEQDS